MLNNIKFNLLWLYNWDDENNIKIKIKVLKYKLLALCQIKDSIMYMENWKVSKL